ncbi:hypothetical protein PQQ64_19925 [Paraburkholderia graminis]|uniref:hypothetical protein n=1 Tax=Paraburkholderia graminis TaxID=60548 RepID=UPI0038B7B696
MEWVTVIDRCSDFVDRAARKSRIRRLLADLCFFAQPMNSAHPVCADEKSSLIIAARWQRKFSISRDNFR